ncbi:flagellar hook-associated protein FlgK [Trinickia caryophylli]|uniref:Flagellar hook-associated protein 1 n=1 Tax=Trinickia caryophylli TaxID=28094 RepID=A0A1X7FHI5_TRICW|nr:flagellar hook-associated protein FlgK [Trinickia caryophylli]PMS13266.1 flagellar hook-associated protein FlgK [Trinickia caryophylli]TRX19208.1 flagellar hook-associated protein FlgK [Trinickia caryophylli]WQE13492.1 flagellar hook-associated protein FlgK [Trinickia caryophylli]SMF51839.1 flagellar hook-associated protein 1 FlgK [Trinickia caryophylli]GLU33979.1 flagellar hook-associated protein FlgK [Trinickia caryophylli]
MSNNIFSVGLSGLAAAQWGLQIAGNNISNASTTGYTVENAVYAESSGQYTGSGYLGGGVTTVTVLRNYSQYLATQLNTATSTNSGLSTNYSMTAQLNNLVGSPTAGISTAITAYFTGLQNVANGPTNLATRQSAMSAAQTLASQLSSAGAQYDQLRQSINSQLTTAVNQVNQYSKTIADLNQQIASASAQGQPPNQLLDQRDQAVADLSKLVGVNVVQGSEGYSVFLSSGQPLVVANQNFELGTKVSGGDPSELDVTYNGMPGTPSTTTQYLSESVLSDGTIGGLLAFRSQTLDPAEAQLGAIATSFSAQVNAQNALGLDLSGSVGGNLFNVASPTVYSNLANTGSGALTAAFANPAQPTAGDYTLSYNGTAYTLTDNATGSVIGTAASIASTGTTIGGLTLSLSGTMNTGDSFTILPTRGALNSFSLATTDASDIAAASPVLVSATASNTGGATVTQGTVAAGYTLPATPLTLTYSGGQLTGFPAGASVSVNGAAATTGTSFPYASGNTYTYNGMTFTVSGSPNNGDTFTIAKNTGTDDGRNALAMSKLISQQTLGNGTATLTGAYANYVNNVGNAASQLKATSTAQTALVKQITESQQSVSGVNLDEEAGNLLKYQQLYQANSKVIQTAQSMFQTLMGIF